MQMQRQLRATRGRFINSTDRIRIGKIQLQLLQSGLTACMLSGRVQQTPCGGWHHYRDASFSPKYRKSGSEVVGGLLPLLLLLRMVDLNCMVTLTFENSTPRLLHRRCLRRELDRATILKGATAHRQPLN
jgi:hypothetical protein